MENDKYAWPSVDQDDEFALQSQEELMAFRRYRDDWDDFLTRHGPELRECGISDYVVAKKMRFLVFLDHGYDDWGRVEDRHAFFDAKVLSHKQIVRLAKLVG